MTGDADTGTPRPGGEAREAVGTLFEEQGDRIYGLGLRICGTPDAAEDLVQETFLRALRSWDGFDGRSKPSTWLYTIASRACGRMHRLRAGQPPYMESIDSLLPSGDEGIIQLPSRDDPEADIVLREASDAVVAVVRELPLDFRLPFVLKEMAGLSVQEIATALGLNDSTVKTRLHRARLRVRKVVAEGLPARPGEPPSRRREECLALLKAKQEAMDRDADFPLTQGHVCERCRSVFRTLDFTRDACQTMSAGEMPDDLRRSLEVALAG
ncbi:MAG: RNA polymerase sigma factor [Gemmatimonadota bacterium]|nr:RNA polymerase sigma factor [Gemmatimonadota bacterium]